jgi:hypothetical protein
MITFFIGVFSKLDEDVWTSTALIEIAVEAAVVAYWLFEVRGGLI